jgi:hypothetical protein
MHKLIVLEIARNRIKRMRRTCIVISKLKSLTELDMRDNPLTLGFYAPEKCGPNRATDGPQNYYSSLSRDVDEDKAWLRLLDETTQLKRRAMELLLLERCLTLRQLDGSALVCHEGMRTDQTWEILKDREVLSKPAPMPDSHAEHANGATSGDDNRQMVDDNDGTYVTDVDLERSTMAE